MKNNEKLDTFIPMGKLFVRDFTYFLIGTVDNLQTWEQNCHRFLVVPIDPLYQESLLDKKEAIFRWARHLAISGDFLIEYGTYEKIQCMRSPEEW